MPTITDESPSEPKPGPKYLGLILFAIALAIRLLAISWGLPNEVRNHSYHPDEEVVWQVSQRIEPAKLDFSPGFYNYGTLYLTTLRITSDAVAAYGGGPKTEGLTEAEQVRSFYDYVGRCHLAGRVLSALFGAGLVWVIFALGRQFMEPFGAAVAALAAAFGPALVVHSRFQTVDMLAALLFALSVLFGLRVYFHQGSLAKMATLSGVFAGLSAGTKYSGILALASLAVATLFLPKAERLKPLAMGCGAALLAFFIATPGAIFDREAFVRDFTYELNHTASGHGLVFEGLGSGFMVHLGNLGATLTAPIVLLGIGGLGWAAYRRQPWLAMVGASALLTYLAIGRAEVMFLRYVFPLTVAICLGVGYLAHSAQNLGGRYKLGAAMVLLFLGNALAATWTWTAGMFLDPRDIVARYLKEQKGTTVGLVSDPWFYTPPLFPDAGATRGLLKFQLEEMAKTENPRVIRFVPENPDERQDWDVRLLDQNPDFVVFSSFEAGDPARLRGRQDVRPEAKAVVDRFAAFHARLEKEYEIPGRSGDAMAAYFQDSLLPHDLMYVRPTMYLWKRKTTSARP